MNLQGFEFTNGFKNGDVHIFERLNKLSKNIFELGFYQDQNTWKHEVIPIEVSKNDSDGVSDLLILKIIEFAFKIKKFFLGNH